MTFSHSADTSRGLGALAITFMMVLSWLYSPLAAADNPRYASIVIDAESGEVLHAANADATRYPASLTKMMTLYLLFEAIEDGSMSMDQTLPVSSHAAAQPPSKLWVRPGDRITVKEAILALIVRSANDVAVVVAEGLAGSERAFAGQMTDKALALGMPSTTFRNASGLPDDDQVTTARDMAMLSLHLMQDFPQYYGYFSRERFTYKGKVHKGHNRLLDSYAGTDGLKTGYIRDSGFNVATSAVHDGRRIVSVVMGGFTARSRDAHMAELLDRGFARAKLLARSDWVAKADVFNGTVKASSAVPAVDETDGSLVDVTLIPEPTSRKVSLSQAQATPPSLDDDDPIQALMTRVGNGQVRPAEAWAVQVGAFRNRVGAQQRATQAAGYLSTELGQPQVAVMPSDGEQRLFRARLMGMQENQARRSCQQLMQQGMDCVVVHAGGGG